MNLATIRHATINDIDDVVPLFEAYRSFYGEAGRMNEAREFLRDRWILGESKLIIALDAGQTVGFTQLFPSFSSVTLQRLWILNDLFVLESARGKGIGRKLLHAAAEFGQTTSAKQLFIEGAVDNPVARGLYEDFGFIRNDDYMYFHLPLPLKARHLRD